MLIIFLILNNLITCLLKMDDATVPTQVCCLSLINVYEILNSCSAVQFCKVTFNNIGD